MITSDKLQEITHSKNHRVMKSIVEVEEHILGVARLGFYNATVRIEGRLVGNLIDKAMGAGFKVFCNVSHYKEDQSVELRWD